MNSILDGFRILDQNCLHFRVRFDSKESKKIADLKNFIEQINGLIPLMNFGGDNPNNNNPHHTFDIGREYTRVIYINVVKAYMPKDFSYDKLRSQIEKVAIKHYADEKDVIENTPSFFQMRIWWD